MLRPILVRMIGTLGAASRLRRPTADRRRTARRGTATTRSETGSARHASSDDLHHAVEILGDFFRVNLVGERTDEDFADALHLQRCQAALDFARRPFARRTGVVVIARRLLVVADAHQSDQPVGMPRHRLRDLVVGRVARDAPAPASVRRRSCPCRRSGRRSCRSDGSVRLHL